MSEALVELRDVKMSFDKGIDVLAGVNFSVSPSDFVLLTGPNGGGKTTLVRIMLGLLSPTSGVVKVRKDLIMGYLPQYQKIDRQFPISVEDMVLSGMLSRKRAWNSFSHEQREHVKRLLEIMQLADYRHAPVSTLSGGQLQRALFARAVASEPDLLILDEPDTYLDRNFQQHLSKLLDEYSKRCAIVLVTHNPHGIERLATRICRVDGNICEVNRDSVYAAHIGHVDGD